LTDKYCLIGENVSRSPSPAMMNAAFDSVGLDAVYSCENVARQAFRETFARLRSQTSGMNVTIPYKSMVIPLLDGLDEVSSRIGAVNVIKKEEARLMGFNSDANGILVPLREHGKESLRRALLLGAGGAARAFCEAMNQTGCTEVTVAVREPSRGENFIKEMSEVFPGIAFSITDIALLRDAEFDLIFNATPIGTGEQRLPDSLKRVIYGRSTVFDAVYRPMKTELIRTAEARGCATILGYEMLLNQGTLAFEIWTGKAAPKDVMRKSLLHSLEAAS